MATTNIGVMLIPEGTPGTLEAADGAYAVECSRCDFTATGSPIRRGLLPGRIDWRKPATPHGRYWNVDLAGEVKAQTAVDVPGELSGLLQSAGFTETITPGTGVEYTLTYEPNAAANQKSLSVYLEEGLDGNSYKGHGFRPGNLTFEFGVDKALTWSCSGPAGYNVPAAVVANTALTLNAGVPLVLCDNALVPTAFGYDLILRSGSISVGLESAPRAHLGNSYAYGYNLWPAVLNRTSHVSFTLEIESVDETAFALYTKWAAGTSSAVSIYFTADGGTSTTLLWLPEAVFDPPTRTAGAPNVHNLSGIAGFPAGTSGSFVISTS